MEARSVRGTKEVSQDAEDPPRPVRRSLVAGAREEDEVAQSASSTTGVRRAGREPPPAPPRAEDEVSAFRRAVRDWEAPDDDRVSAFRKMVPDDFKLVL